MKKALLVASFGTSYEEADRNGIQPVEEALAKAYPDWTVARAFTSRMIIGKLRRNGTVIETVEEALERLKAEGYDKIAIASTHIIPGVEYEQVKQAANGLLVSAPLLENKYDLDWMARQLSQIAEEEGRPLLVMGHGTECQADDFYGRLQKILPENVILACVEGSHALEMQMDKLNALLDREITLMPMMLVAGDHARCDMAGDQEDSWKSILERCGFQVSVRMHGLGALESVQSRFVSKVRQVVERTESEAARIAILHCRKSSDVCTGAGCMRVFNRREKSFAQYTEPTELWAFMDCGGCEIDHLHDEGMCEKLERLQKEGVEKVHIGPCVFHKCPHYQEILKSLEHYHLCWEEGTH